MRLRSRCKDQVCGRKAATALAVQSRSRARCGMTAGAVMVAILLRSAR